MDQTVIAEIEETRRRLADIAERRRELPEDAFAERTDLLDEEHELDALLAELNDRAVEEVTGEAEEQVAARTGLTKTPRLPDTGPRS